jgi:ribosomal protein S18 acetylase RimI-like enzyme
VPDCESAFLADELTEGDCVWFAFVNGVVVGGVKVSCALGKTGANLMPPHIGIDSLSVESGFRRRGYGRALMTFVHDWLGEQLDLPDAVSLGVDIDNTPAIGLYESMGYRILTDAKGNPVHIDDKAIVMWTRLPSDAPVSVRPMTLRDAGAAADLCRAVLNEPGPWTYEWTAQASSTFAATATWERFVNTRLCFVAERGDEIAGVAWLYPSGTIGHIGGHFVRYRRQGIGTVLTKARLDAAVELGCTSAEAEVAVWNTPSQRNLRAAGFRVLSEQNGQLTFVRELP